MPADALRQLRCRGVASATATSRPVLCYFADWAEVPLPPGHRFPMDKYRAVRQLLEEDSALVGQLRLEPSPLASLDDVLRVHCAEYVQRVLNGTLSAEEQRVVGFPWSEAHVKRSLASTGGTVAAARAVLTAGSGAGRCAMQLAGGTHHAHRANGEGFCVFNDLACAAGMALDEYGLSRILVVDVDVHQGNGTADIFRDDPRVTTFSMHGAKNYPFEGRSRRRSSVDVELDDDTSDDAYMSALHSWLPRLFEQQPQLVLLQAGVDPLQGDAFGRLGLTRAGLAARNNAIFSAVLASGSPLVITMGGGYAKPIERSVEAHADVFRAAAMRFSLAVS